MGVRRQAREWALQVLFQLDFNEGDLSETLAHFWEDKRPSPRGLSFAEEIVYGVSSQRKEIDDILSRCAKNYVLSRMGAVDRNAMRIAVYEMLARDDIPAAVSIDEAVELAKRFSNNLSGRFVNGILDHVRRELNLPAT